MILFIGLSSFDSKPVEVKKLTGKILIHSHQDVFTKYAQEALVITVQRATSGIPCSQGACVCTNWYPAQGNTSVGYWRQCGCYGEMNNFWNEYKPCYYCVPTPNYGQDCQNGGY